MAPSNRNKHLVSPCHVHHKLERIDSPSLESGAFRDPVTACLLLHHLLESSLFSRQIYHSLLLRSDGFCCLPPCSVSVDIPSFSLDPAFVDMHRIPFHIISSPLPAVLASPSTAFLPVVAPSLSLARLRVRCGPGSILDGLLLPGRRLPGWLGESTRNAHTGN